ncbi:hypothetical protein V6N13_015201 [Hibiscus sabdariffa]
MVRSGPPTIVEFLWGRRLLHFGNNHMMLDVDVMVIIGFPDSAPFYFARCLPFGSVFGSSSCASAIVDSISLNDAVVGCYLLKSTDL